MDDYQQNQAADSSQRTAYTLEDVVWGIAAALFSWLLRYFSELQDALLAIPAIRHMALWALNPSAVQELVDDAVTEVEDLEETFESMPYHVSSEAQRLLLHAGTHVLLQGQKGTEQLMSDLPPLNRVLLQTGADSGRFQMAVASALSRKLGTNLLIVDDKLLASVTRATLGQPPPPPPPPPHDETRGSGSRSSSSRKAPGSSGAAAQAGAAGAGGGVVPYVLSFFLCGGRLAFAWDALRQACVRQPRPLIVLIPSAEKLICGTQERFLAFCDALADSEAADRQQGSPPLLMLAGTELVDTGGHLVGSRGARGQDATGPPRGIGPSGDDYPNDDGMPRLLPTAAELGLSLDNTAPDVRQQLSSLFPVQVNMGRLPEGEVGARHRAQIATDAEFLKQKSNFSALSAAAESSPSCLRLPDEESLGVLFKPGEVLSVSDWQKVLSWACRMEMMMKQATESAALEGKGSNHGTEAGGDHSRGKPNELSNSDLVDLWMHQTPKEGDREEGRSDGAQKGSEATPALPGQVVLHQKAPRARGTNPGSSGRSRSSIADDGSEAEEAGPPPVFSVRLGALRYGLEMFRQSGGSLRKQIKPENQYEKALLSEVLFPEDAGGGFNEVGALNSAKDALREAVQLPLQHAELFGHGKGVLAAPCKGVLLFGPPGTGKTMLARAAAAECGASFLVLSPSAVVSKWLGDGVKLVRAAFSLADKLSPCCMFVDEVDALLGRRDSQSEHEAVRELKNEFMAQWDGISSGGVNASRVMVLAATNRPQDLDEAVLRRFNKRVFCDLPNLSGRTEILQAILSGERLADDVSTEKISASCEGFSGSDLRRLATCAFMRPVREFLKANSCASNKGRCVTTDKGRKGSEKAAADEGDDGANELCKELAVVSNEVSASDEETIAAAARRAVLDECEEMSCRDSGAQGQAALRPVSAADFTDARLEVTTSVNADSHAMTELRQWNLKFGEGDRSGYKDTALSYFM